MHTLWIWSLLGAGLAAALIALAMLSAAAIQRRNARKREQEQFAEALESLTQGESRLQEFASALAEAQKREAEARRKADEYRATIEIAQNERDGWMRRYWQQSYEHGNAQAMMLECIEQNHQRMRKAGVQPIENPSIRSVMDHFQENHAGPAREALKHKASSLVNEAMETPG